MWSGLVRLLLTFRRILAKLWRLWRLRLTTNEQIVQLTLWSVNRGYSVNAIFKHTWLVIVTFNFFACLSSNPRIRIHESIKPHHCLPIRQFPIKKVRLERTTAAFSLVDTIFDDESGVILFLGVVQCLLSGVLLPCCKLLDSILILNSKNGSTVHEEVVLYMIN